ncbi:TonB-dependent receptor [Pedobacter gandavensis]|uniref:SusC/RagA family TonB-linked outer membrane protein n=1 Tax=Pedobacter gandavensis TaxID=2679963 RepID=UPI002930C32F|nr:TonB-dependent receptor [Pedobacter gandavensis]
MKKRKLLCSRGFFYCSILLTVLIYPSIVMTTTAQANISEKEKTYSIGFDNKPILHVFSKIESLSGLRFAYSPKDIKQVKSITIEEKDRNIVELLKELSSKTGLAFNLSQKMVAVTVQEGFPFETTPVRVATKIKADTVIQGSVTDSLKQGLPGVSVFVKGKPRIGTSTDINGRYSIQVPGNAILVFKMVGYITIERPANKATINVTLAEDKANLDEVQVVAFGTQKKSNVVGSITTIKPSELKVPSSNLTTALAGKIAGVIAYQRSGEPGADNAQFFIRGITTFGVNNVPLILIDNIELTPTDLARMQVDDIASFSVLKDASATALYGARGANGVILVTTKQGKVGPAKVNVRLENSLSTATKDLELADPVTYMQMYREAQLTRGNLTEKYTQTQIDNTILGTNPLLYPVVDWQEMLLQKNTMNQRANASVSGGAQVAQYYVSGSFNRDNGILKVPKVSNFNNNIKLNTYLLRSNVNINLSPTTELVVRLSGTFDDYKGPIDGGTGVYNKIMQASPTAFPAFYPADSANRFTQHILFGNSGDRGQFINPYADMVKGYRQSSSSRMLAQLELNQKMDAITEGLSFRAIGSTNRYSYFSVTRSYNPFFYNIGSWDAYTKTYTLNLLNREAGPTEYLSYPGATRNATANLYLLAAMDYSRAFGKSAVSASLISTIEENLDVSKDELVLSLPHRNLGVSGRATYSYDSRYFVEFNFGYNGSERFHVSRQFGFFPTIGAGWMVSNEKFWEGMANTITKLKFRGSYGLVGNDAIGSPNQRFFYLSNVSLNDSGRGASFGFDQYAYYRPGVSISAYGNDDITWETSKQTNLAMEIEIKRDLNIVAEYWRQNRTNILMARNSIPTTMGLASVTYANVGAAKSSGVDLSLDYNKMISTDLSVTVRANMTYSTSKITAFEEPDYSLTPYRSRIGKSVSQNWGYIAERLFIDDGDVANSPKQNFGVYGPGDLKYTDVNGDGQVTQEDAVPLGLPTSPEIVYGFGFTAKYKNFDLSAFAQGIGRESFWIDSKATAPFVDIAQSNYGENALLKAYAESHWSEENRDLYAMWPRLSISNALNNNNYQTSSWFMRNGAFLRLKSVEFGYSFSKSFIKKLKMDNLRIYVNGTNLASISSFKLWDVEMGGNGLGYPLQKVFNIGLNVNF